MGTKRRTLLAIIFSLSIVVSAVAGGPCGKKSEKANKQTNLTEEQIQYQKQKVRFNKKHHLKKVVNANPQHAGYPKADTKGDFPSRINKNEYYVEE